LKEWIGVARLSMRTSTNDDLPSLSPRMFPAEPKLILDGRLALVLG
jgi:hypothetical protein